METGQFKHPVNSVLEGILLGITDMSQEGQLTINLLLTNINQDELEKIIEKREDNNQPGFSQPSGMVLQGTEKNNNNSVRQSLKMNPRCRSCI